MKGIFRRLIGCIFILQLLTLANCRLAKRNVQNNLRKTCIGMATDRDRILEMRGNIIKLSDIDWKICFWRPNIIRLFAAKKVLIDVDLNKVGRRIQLSIIAPIWNVMIDNNKQSVKPGFRIINLNGMEGKNHDIKKASNGNEKGNKNGDDGLAGLPGGPAGSFFGVADKIENGEKLIIHAIGGKGGAGQNGGDGVTGDKGGKFMLQNSRMSCSGRAQSTILEFLSAFSQYPIDYDAGIGYGEEGERGGAAGNGGIGGMGGNKGDIKIIQLSSRSPVKMYARKGKVGEIGFAGQPGNGGKNGDNARLICADSILYIEAHTYFPSERYGKIGIEGKDGVSFKLRREARELPVQDITRIVNQYKEFLREIIAKSVSRNQQALLKFYKALMTHGSVEELSDTRSLVEEFTSIEEQHYRLCKKMDFGFSYKALQRRILNYKEGPKPDENSQEYKNVLDDLNTDILSRIDNLEFFDSLIQVKTNVKTELKDRLSPINNKLYKLKGFYNVLNQIKEEVSPLEKLIEHGQEKMNVKLQSALSNFDNVLNNKVDTILGEIVKLKKSVHANERHLRESRELLNKYMTLKVSSGIFYTTHHVLMEIHPVLGTAALAGELILDEIATEGMNEIKKNVKAVVIPDSIKKLAEVNLQKGNEKYLEIIRIQRDYAHRLTEGKSVKEASAVNNVWDSTRRLRRQIEMKSCTSNIGWAMMKKYADQEESLSKALANLKPGSSTYLVYELGLRATRYLKTTSRAFQATSAAEINFLTNPTAIDEIGRAMLEDNKSLNELTKAAYKIYTETEPMLRDMGTQLGQLLKSERTTDKVEFIMKKYNVKHILNYMKETLRKISADSGSSDLDWAIEDCMEQFELVFSLQETLLEHKNEVKNKIGAGNLHIAHASNLLVPDFKLKHALSKLQVVMSSNVLVERYQEWISDFKQYVFPYTGWGLRYFQDLDIFKGKTVTDIARNIQTTVTDHPSDMFRDSDLMANKFETVFKGSLSKHEGSRSFIYRWQQENFQKVIDKILSGRKGILVADIEQGDSKNSYDALKFNLVKLLFTVNNRKDNANARSNSLLQEELNNLLGNFALELTHSGVSTYKFRNSLFKCINAPKMFRVNYSEAIEGKSKAAKESSKGAHMLSPYTTWSIKLVPLNPNIPKPFRPLRKFKGNVDLELVGNVEYYTKRHCDFACKKVMEDYYKVEVIG